MARDVAIVAMLGKEEAQDGAYAGGDWSRQMTGIKYVRTCALMLHWSTRECRRLK